MYEHFEGDYGLVIPSAILGAMALVVTIPIYVFYWKGPAIRAKSKFAQQLASDREMTKDMRNRRGRGEKAGPETGNQTV